MRLCAGKLFLLCCFHAAAGELRSVWSGPDVNLLGAPSPDGRYLSFADPQSGNLSIRDLKSGSTTHVTSRKQGSREYAYFSVFSRDSKRIAFAWFNDAGFYELRVIGVDGSGERVLYRNEEVGFVQPCAWSPGDDAILTLLFRSDNISQIVMVPSAGGQPKVLRSLNWVYPKRMDLSPDGRFIAYDSFAEPGGGDRTLFLLSTSGDRETQLLTEPGNHLFPLWTPDGKSLIYTAEREGRMNVSVLNVEKGSTRVLLPDVARPLPMGITAAGDYFLGTRSDETDVFVTSLADPLGKPLRATIRYPGRNSNPAFSSDGKWLAYLSRTGIENFGEAARALVIRSMDADEERMLTPKLALVDSMAWSPDTRSLLISGTDGKGRAGVFIVGATSGDTRLIVTGSRGTAAAWCPDGKSIMYVHDRDEVRVRPLEGDGERTLLRASAMRHIAIAPSGFWAAAATAEAVHLVPLKGGQVRVLLFPGATDLQWQRELIAARGTDLYRIPLDGSAPSKIAMPGNRIGRFSLHPDGSRVAIAAGKSQSEVKVLRLP